LNVRRIERETTTDELTLPKNMLKTMDTKNKINFDDFMKVEVRTGTILACKPFEKAKKPAWKLEIDFGNALGTRMSSAQITHHYTPADLVGKQIIAVVNFPNKQIADFQSEVLVLGVSDADGHIVLLQPEQQVPNGARMH
jgi:tRNA-binding protein